MMVRDLNLPRVITEIALHSRGLVVLAGSRESGRSHTLAAMIEEINQAQARHIVILEETHEVIHSSRHSLITQRQVSSRFWPAAMRVAARENPDVLVLSCLPSRRCLRQALQLAAQGATVLAVSRGRSVTRLVERLLAVLPSWDLGAHLTAVLVQHLVPATHPGTCVPAVEVLRATPAVGNLLREGKLHQLYSAMQTGTKRGMQTLEMSLCELVQLGMVEENEALLHCQQPTEMRRLLGVTAPD